MKPRVYVETSVISYLTARPSNDAIALSQQQATREWWENSRLNFDVWISDFVLDEVQDGDAGAAIARLAVAKLLPTLPANEESEMLTRLLLQSGAFDPIIEELHQYREAYAARFNYDVSAIFADIRRKGEERLRQEKLTALAETSAGLGDAAVSDAPVECTEEQCDRNGGEARTDEGVKSDA